MVDNNLTVMWYELYNLLFAISADVDWNDKQVDKLQARDVFTTMCLIFDIEADTEKCDSLLDELYSECVKPSSSISKDKFENFMLHDIV